MEKFAITLAGGGSKGIYQIGAWKALKELGIEYEAVTGTSIGAINGALMVQGDLQKACDMWNDLRIDHCVRLPENAKLVSDNLMDRQHAGMLIREVIAHGGIDQSPLFDLVAQYIDLSLIYSSSVDFGLCTFSLSNRSSLKVWRADIPQAHFLSYVMASCALPGLRSVKLDDQVYLDGGISDNLPFDMLRRRGLRNIIAIDLRPPKNRTIRTDRLRITHICNSLDLGGTLDLTPAILTRNFELGYLDTKKTFGFLDGIHYYLPVLDYQQLLSNFENGILAGLEQAALLYELPRDHVYTAQEFLHSLSLCRDKAAAQYAVERQRIDADGILTSVRNGSLNRLKHMSSSVRLALLMELMSDVKKNGGKWPIPLRFFRDVDQAAEALLHLEP
jgi:NTE family protein